MKVERIVVGPLATNCYLLVSDRVAAIIDPGAEGERIAKAVEAAGARLEKIIITHHHFDHVDGLDGLLDIYGAAVMAHRNEKDYAKFRVNSWLQDHDIISLGKEGLAVVDTPGHTRGSFCLFGPGMVFTGDTLFHTGCGRTDLPGGDEAAMSRSLAKLKKKIQPGMMVYPGHGEIYEA